MKNIISTFTGQSFNVLSPDPARVKIEDIAHALSLLCRANGHFNRFYSVAEHSINCCREAAARGYDRTTQLCCLLHDASEAYMCDIPRPIKGKDYMANEDRLEKAILTALAPQCVEAFFKDGALWREIDDAMLYREFDTYYKTDVKENPIPDKGQRIRITMPSKTRPFEEVQTEFLALYGELKNHEDL